MIAGGAEAIIIPLTIAGFCQMKAMSTRNDEPDAGLAARSTPSATGSCAGRAAGIVVLESLEHAVRRGARIYAEMVGYGMTRRRPPHDRPRSRGGRRGARHGARR